MREGERERGRREREKERDQKRQGLAKLLVAQGSQLKRTARLPRKPLHFAMPLSEEETENMLDGFIERYGQDNFSYSLRDVPLTKMKTDQAEPSTIDDLPVRPLPARHIANMFDVHKGIPGDISEEDIGRAMRDGNWDQLPEVVRPRAPLPEGAVLQWVIQRAADNTLNVLKHFIFDKKMRAAEAQDLVTGEASAPLWRANTWGVKKGYQAFMDNMPGYHVMYASLAQKMAKDHKESGWNPTAEEVKEGIMFINQKIPMDKGQGLHVQVRSQRLPAVHLAP